MKKSILILFLTLMVSSIMIGCKNETPTDVVNAYFTAIKSGETEKVQKMIEETVSQGIDDEQKSDEDKSSEEEKLDKSLIMYFSKIDAKVLTEKITEDNAVVEVELKGPNYSSLILETMQESMELTFSGKEVSEEDLEKSIEEKVTNASIETRKGKVNLTKADDTWTIKSDEDIANLLLGNVDEEQSEIYSK